MNLETKIQRNIMIAISQAGHTVWRNETGNFWTGRVIHKEGNTTTLANAQMIPCGLCKGSSDLIGITSQGIFFAIEVKTAKGRTSKEQDAFIKRIQEQGGIAGVARSPQDALDLLSR
jgi:hypothetical protein